MSSSEPVRRRAAVAVLLLLLCRLEVIGGPRLISPDPICRFGTVTNNDRAVEGRFSVRNVGDTPTAIEVDPMGCGCTVSALSTNVLGPGGTAELKVSLPLRGRDGPVMKRFLVRSVPPGTDVLLGFLGGIDLPATAYPSRIFFGAMPTNRPALEQETVIRFSSTRPDMVTGLNIDTLCYTAAWTEVRRGREYSIRVRTVPAALPAEGPCDAVLAVHTAGRGTNAMTIPVVGRVVASDLLVGPDILSVPARLESPLTLYAMLTYRGTGHLEVVEAVVTGRDVRVRTFPMADNRCRIDIQDIPSASAVSGAVLRIRTNLPDHERIEIPFAATSR